LPYAATILANQNAGASFGLLIGAGTTAGDSGFLVQNSAATLNYVVVFGDGHQWYGPNAGTNGLIITSTGALQSPSTPVSAALTTVFTGLAAFKATPTTSSSSALATDASLTITFNELGWYVVEIWLPFYEATSGLGGFQANFLNGGTAGFANLSYSVEGFGTSAIALASGQTSSAVAFSATAAGTASATPSWFRAKGIVQVTSTGTAGVQWAQASTLGVDPTTLMAGAYVIATKIG
jgi:hypothetical protein